MLRKPGLLIAIFGIAGAILAGCGSSSPNRPAATAAVSARQTPLMSNPDVGRARPQSSHTAAQRGQLPSGRSRSTARADKSRVTTATVVRARQTPSTSKDDTNTATVKPLNPCTLVRLSEAQSITRGAITKMIEAPLGPTCIYSGTRHATGVTLTVETQSFSQMARHMSAPKHLVVSGHRSVCGRLGTSMLFIPLGRNRLLNVTAPCEIAQRFGALAVSRLAA